MPTSNIMKALLKIARAVLEGVLDEIANQGRILEAIEDAIRGNYLPSVSSWIGEDADAFRGEVETRLLPAIVELIAAIFGMSTGVSSAHEIMQTADAQCSGQAENLADVFRNIY